MEDSSLSDFLGDDEDGCGGEADATADEPTRDAGATDDGGDDPVDGSEAGDGTDAPSDVAAATYRWTPHGADCAACGATVERRWRDDGALVCLDCKDW